MQAIYILDLQKVEGFKVILTKCEQNTGANLSVC